MNGEQLKAILWLRWRLSKNQFLRGGKFNAVFSVLLFFYLVVGSIGISAGSVIGGFFVGSKAPAEVLLLIWDGILFAFLMFWGAGVMTEIQRSESIDLTKLLHLPISLNQVFVLNYIASHATQFVIFSGLGFCGFSFGLVLGGGFRFVLVLPLVLGFFFMVSAWTYCLRGWLAALMTNKRRKRSIVVWTTLCIVMLGQLPNAAIQYNNWHRREARTQAAQIEKSRPPGSPKAPTRLAPKDETFVTPQILQAHLFIPPAWVAYGAMTLKQGNPWPSLGWALVFWAAGCLGLMKSYRMTLHFYRGASSSKPTALAAAKTVPTAAAPRSNKPLLIERRLKPLPDDLAGMAAASFLTLIRSPELKMAAILPVIVLVVFFFADFGRALEKIPEGARLFPVAGVIALTCFTFMQTAGNIFGLDRSAFRGIVLLPTPRHYVLMAKNLAMVPFQLVVAVLLFGAVLWKLPFSLDMLLTGLVQIPAGIIVMSLFSNMFAILAPYRMALGSLKAQKPPAIVFLASLIGMFLMPFMMIPLAIPGGFHLLFHSQGWTPWLPIGFISGLFVLAIAGALYAWLIPVQGRLLQRRELHILKQVTEEVE